MDAHQFDRLTKSLAGGSSRRRVLKGLSGAVGAAALAAVGRDAGRAAPGGNSACAHFCTAALPPGPERGRCVSDAAHGTGTCVDCGANPSNYCNGSCCTGGQTCDSSTGTCSCPMGQTPCNYAPCEAGGFYGGTFCCETCTPDGMNPGYSLCSGHCSSHDESNLAQDDCPEGMLCYQGTCYGSNETSRVYCSNPR